MKHLAIYLLFTSLVIVSCNSNVIDGIIIRDTLYINTQCKDLSKLKSIIERLLNEDETALIEIKNFWCGAGSGCYDLGFVLTQIIYRIGEPKFIAMVQRLNINEIKGINGLICAGLEYGDNNKDGQLDNKKFDEEFPSLFKIFNN